MTFYICGPGATTCANTSGNLLTGTTSFPNPATLSGGTATSASFTPNAAGTWCFSAVYSGDSNYNGSSDNTGSSNADANECVTVAKGPSTTKTTASPSSLTLSPTGTVTDSVTVSSTSSPPGPTPSGTVTFYICGPGATTCANTSGNLLTGTTSFPNPATLSGGTATSASFTPNAAGTWCFSAVYSGDSNYNGSSDNTGSSNADANECVTVAKGPSTTKTTASPSSLTLSPTGTVTDSVTVSSTSSPPGPTPSGTVTFYICGPGATTCANTSGNLLTGTTSFPNPATLSGGTATSASFTPNAAGTWCFSAVYSGDSNYNGSSDNTGSSNADANECVTVAKGPSTTKTTASPSSLTLSPTGTVTDSVTVSSTSSPPGPTPSGTVTFYICGPGATTCANTSGNLLTGTTSFPNPATLSGGTATLGLLHPQRRGHLVLQRRLQR